MRKSKTWVSAACLCLVIGMTGAAMAVPPAGTWDYNADFAPVAPTIDGVITAGEYTSTPLVMNRATMGANGGSYMTGDPLFSGLDPAGTSDADLSGTYYMVWDQTYLYIAANIVDDQVLYPLNQGQPLNAADIMQIAFEATGDPAAGATTANCSIHDVAPGQKDDNNTPAYFQHWPDASPTPFSSATYDSSLVAGGYQIELRLKWSEFAPVIAPSVGKMIGYLALLMDFDTVSGTDKTEDLWFNGGNHSNVIGNCDKYNKLFLRTDPNDTDMDGLSNADEAALGTDPNNPDSDADGVKDGQEVTDGTDPADADSDNDGLNDGAEKTAGSDPNDADSDNDGLNDGDEVNTHGTDPLKADTDNDGINDKDEIDGTLGFVTDPTKADSDNDGIADKAEIDGTLGFTTDPTKYDTDGDGAGDLTEINNGTDPTDPDSVPSVPVAGVVGLGLLALAIGAAARRRCAK